MGLDGLFKHGHQVPALVPAHGPVFHNLDLVADAALIHGVVGGKLLTPTNVLLEQRMLNQSFNEHDNGLVALVADHSSDERSAVALLYCAVHIRS